MSIHNLDYSSFHSVASLVITHCVTLHELFCWPTVAFKFSPYVYIFMCKYMYKSSGKQIDRSLAGDRIHDFLDCFRPYLSITFLTSSDAYTLLIGMYSSYPFHILACQVLLLHSLIPCTAYCTVLVMNTCARTCKHGYATVVHCVLLFVNCNACTQGNDTISAGELVALQIVSYIGCAISIICLIATIIFFLAMG